MATLPTVPGTIVSFSSDFESDDGPFTYGAALIPGVFDTEGNLAVSVWGTADLLDIDDGSNSFTPEFLATQDLTVVSQPERLATPLAIDADEARDLDYGSVIAVDIFGETVYQTFAPLYIDQETGSVAEAGWISAYGEVVNFDEADAIRLIYRGV